MLARNLARRKLRTALTIIGITVGIWALVVFGALASKIDLLVSGAHDYFGNKVVVSSAAGGGGMFPLSSALVARAQVVDGVDVAYGEINTMVDHDAKQVGLPDEIVGLVAGSDRGRDTFPYRFAAGRPLGASDAATRNVVLGADLARKNGAAIGGTIRLRGVEFAIVGILEPTLTLPDSQAFLPMAAAQDLYVIDLPEDVAKSIVPSDTITHIVVYPTAGTDVEALSARLEAALPSVTTLTASEFDETIGATANLLSAIIVGVGLISLIVGGLSVVNTMAMSVNERTREIGIKRAIGGSRRRIVAELVAESGLIGLLGGLFGLGLGVLAVTLGNDAGRESGTALFTLTATTAISSVIFATVLGMAAGILPATHAARLDPVQALRHE
ncbi:MAG TPA: ABC transporter permease [Verrucomicrobiae bacterium]|nr:ABC transporter permease [Verrucomicrobiae bacterium]